MLRLKVPSTLFKKMLNWIKLLNVSASSLTKLNALETVQCVVDDMQHEVAFTFDACIRNTEVMQAQLSAFLSDNV